MFEPGKNKKGGEGKAEPGKACHVSNEKACSMLDKIVKNKHSGEPKENKKMGGN